MSRDVMASIEAEFRRYKTLAEKAMAQLCDADLWWRSTESDNNIATIVWHIGGNLRSRFTDFLTSDGEKPWRDRESEFRPPRLCRDRLLSDWESGWRVLLESMRPMRDDDLSRVITIRGVPLKVYEALHRALAHVSYHVGQIVYISKMLRGASWEYLTIPPGGSEQYNRSPAFERAADYVADAARANGDGAGGASTSH